MAEPSGSQLLTLTTAHSGSMHWPAAGSESSASSCNDNVDRLREGDREVLASSVVASAMVATQRHLRPSVAFRTALPSSRCQLRLSSDTTRPKIRPFGFAISAPTPFSGPLGNRHLPGDWRDWRES